MRNKRLGKKHTPIDKSVLAISCRKPVRDRPYLNSFRGNPCEASRNGIDLCGELSVDTVVGAHINDEEYSGVASKTDDDLCLALCYDCHASQTAHPGGSWWLNNVLKPMARRRFRDWKNGNR